MTPRPRHIQTQIVRAAIASDTAYHAVIPPLYLSSTYQIETLEERGPYEYARTRNPTRDHLAEALTALEGGIGASITSSGMSALTLLLHLLGPEDLILAPYDCYGRSYWLLKALAEKRHFRLKFIDPYTTDGLEDAFHEPPRMVLLETPSNPLLRIADIQAIADRTHKTGGLLVCDNTFLSPVLQRPFALGADIILHSTTKFLNGHSDVVGGAVVTGRETTLRDELAQWNNSLGTIGAPFDSYMTLRGLRTLPLRMKQAQDSAQTIAVLLDNHPAVETVYYPGLPSHPQYTLAQRQQHGAGAMLSFTLKGDRNAVDIFLKTLALFSLAQSLGGTESLICHPATMTHAAMGPQARARAGVTDQLLRLSIGIEETGDLCHDLQTALKEISPP